MKGREKIADEVELIAKCANAVLWRMYRWPDGSITIKSGEDQSGATYVPKGVVATGENGFIDWLSQRRLSPEIVSKIAALLYPVTPRECIHEVDNYDK